MPRPKKDPKDWTTEEAMKKLFPKKVRDQAKKIASSPAETSDKKKSK